MKKIIYSLILVIGLMSAIPFESKAVPAYPYPITIIQPDGSTLTIRIHGDEFLHWTTTGNRLIEKGDDGFYYYASFNADGKIDMSSSRAHDGMMTSSYASEVTPPAIAVARAIEQRTSRASSPSRSISSGNGHFLVLLIEFSDLEFTISSAQNAFNRLLNMEGYNDNSGTGSVKDYYYDNSRGNFNPTFDVIGPIKVSNGYAYYGKDNGGQGNDSYPRELLVEACRLVDDEVDFSIYDADGDGKIDNVFFYFAGHNQAEGGGSDCIWPHQWSVFNQTVMLDGKRLYNYACSSEYSGSSGTTMCGIGTFSHEFGHVIGLPDFYDVDYSSNGSALGLGRYSLMSSGNYNNSGKTPPYLNSEERRMLGWMKGPTEITASGNYSPQTVDNNFAYFTPTSNEGEYYLYENRQLSGWDAYLPASGLLIYHVDKSQNIVGGMTAAQRWAKGSGINAYASHQCFDLVETVYPESSVSSGSQIPFPGSNNVTSFTYSTNPGSFSWSKDSTGYNLTNITNSGGVVSFTMTLNTDNKTFTGRVSDIFGNPISGVSVSIDEVTPSPSSIATSTPSKSSLSSTIDASYIVTTDNSGTFTFKFSSSQLDISINKTGYAPYSNSISTSARGNYSCNITLPTTLESTYTLAKKYQSASSYSYGYGSIQSYLGALFSYSSSEISALGYAGAEIKTISFMVKGTSASTVKAIIYFDDELVGEKVVSNTNFGTMTTVDVSDLALVIPTDKSVKFGYCISGYDYGYPVAVDDGPAVSGGGFLSNNGTNWESLYDEDVNVIISAQVLIKSSIFASLGYNYILSPKASYAAGDSFTFSLSTNASPAPTSVSWSFDDESKTGGSSVTLTSGSHTVKAVLTYASGKSETLILELDVQ